MNKDQRDILLMIKAYALSVIFLADRALEGKMDLGIAVDFMDTELDELATLHTIVGNWGG